uniref:Uncharacterized protein n=1 Tax=Anguilla anguilla TaxID=7936 RepID=A0A0E9U7D3_ANGAN
MPHPQRTCMCTFSYTPEEHSDWRPNTLVTTKKTKGP